MKLKTLLEILQCFFEIAQKKTLQLNWRANLLFCGLLPAFGQHMRQARNGQVEAEVDEGNQDIKTEDLLWFEITAHENLASSKEFLQGDNRVEKTGILNHGYKLGNNGWQHFTNYLWENDVVEDLG